MKATMLLPESGMIYKKPFTCQVPNIVDVYMDTFGFKKNGIFVEVGSFDCFRWSNTYELAILGWSGMYFEPQPIAAWECLEHFGNRDDIIVHTKALSNYVGRAKLHLGGSLSTLRQDAKDKYMSMDWSKSTGLGDDAFIECEVSTLDVELAREKWNPEFDLLVIDVEGSEVDVLRGFTARMWKPALVIVETHALNEDRELAGKSVFIDAYFGAAGYRKIQEDTINSIYRRK